MGLWIFVTYAVKATQRNTKQGRQNTEETNMLYAKCSRLHTLKTKPKFLAALTRAPSSGDCAWYSSTPVYTHHRFSSATTTNWSIWEAPSRVSAHMHRSVDPASFTSSRMTDLCQTWKVKLFFEAPDLELTDRNPHILQQIYATAYTINRNTE